MAAHALDKRDHAFELRTVFGVQASLGAYRGIRAQKVTHRFECRGHTSATKTQVSLSSLRLIGITWHGWPACAITRGEPPSRGWRGPTGPWRSRAEESAALYGTDLVFVLGADSCSRCGRAQWATAVMRERRALRGDPVGETGEHSIVGRRLARQRKRRFERAAALALAGDAIPRGR